MERGVVRPRVLQCFSAGQPRGRRREQKSMRLSSRHATAAGEDACGWVAILPTRQYGMIDPIVNEPDDGEPGASVNPSTVD
jgi:hypothetical protein